MVLIWDKVTKGTAKRRQTRNKLFTDLSEGSIGDQNPSKERSISSGELLVRRLI